MADIIVDGRVRVSFVPTIADYLTGATLAELADGVLLQSNLVPTGLTGFEATQAEVDNTSLASTFDTRLPGRKSYSGTGLMLKKQSGVDAVLAAVGTEGTDGFVVIRDDIPEDADYAEDDPIEIHPVRTGEFQRMGRGEANTVARIWIPTPIRLPSNKNALVLADA